MEDQQPLVSICIPLFNPRGDFLLSLLESIEQQTYPKIECILVDDHSDNFNESDIPITLTNTPYFFYRNDVNLGMVGNWNKCIQKSHGRLVMLVSQDDILHPWMINTYVNLFINNPDVVMCSCARTFIDEHGNNIQPKLNVNDRKFIFREKEIYRLSGQDIKRLSIRNGNPYGEPSSVMYYRSIYDQITGYDTEFQHAADVDFNIRASSFGTSIYINYPYLFRRRHASNLTKVNFSSGSLTRDRLKLYFRYAKSPPFSSYEINRFKAAMLSFILRDAFIGLKAHNWSVVNISLRQIKSFIFTSPVDILVRLIEIIRTVNIDQM